MNSSVDDMARPAAQPGAGSGMTTAGSGRLVRSLRQRGHWALSALVLVAAIVAWDAASGTVFHEVVLPPPAGVLDGLHALVIEDFGFFWGELQITLFEILAGFVLGTALGLGLGLFFIAVPLSRRMLYPYIVIYHSMPGIALAPLIIAWFGFGPESKIVQAVLGSFFPVFINTMVGLTMVEASGLLLMRSLRASRRQVFMKYRFPNALPAIFAGIRIGLTFAMIGAIVSEFLASERGIGKLIPSYQTQFRIEEMYAVIVVIAVLGLVLFFLVEWLDRKVVFWREPRDRLP